MNLVLVQVASALQGQVHCKYLWFVSLRDTLSTLIPLAITKFVCCPSSLAQVPSLGISPTLSSCTFLPYVILWLRCLLSGFHSWVPSALFFNCSATFVDGFLAWIACFCYFLLDVLHQFVMMAKRLLSPLFS